MYSDWSMIDSPKHYDGEAIEILQVAMRLAETDWDYFSI